MARFLVFGKTGQVAQALQRLLPDAVFLGRDQADLSDPAACAAMVRDCDAVLNAAAWTAVDRAEAEPEAARLVNTGAPAAIAAACAAQGLPFVHVSTDYVFDGSGDQPRNESAATGPLGVYGATKLAGEQAVMAAHPRAVILRTSWVFSQDGSNFVKTMLRLGAEREALTIVADQIGGPTPAADIAEAMLTIVRTMLADPARSGGIYHFSGTPDTSWADFARAIFARAGLPTQVTDIPTSAYPTPAQRPLNSRLDCTAIARDFDITRPDWRIGLDHVLTALETQK
ncbi:MAG: dTDP-4-dehydrorhamnose reductase [Paracoccus sp. (in: a-proteobacteria)]|uniref:dTDP-4-dehydrorhamnose reductase n=1 Tax=Paracoccus sp. TaxID=267 RepID=UPI0026E01548|nr:dTDP-4-dehydrorhamnose reductase [Paracoccus sp. (in: a-proteobacteria)]MDO5621706.1 dTDP-4-dehydrorhamnose reductase [Paracoccus sp. (in: a-proteobacteria)]